jgi:hypothetical protein
MPGKGKWSFGSLNDTVSSSDYIQDVTGGKVSEIELFHCTVHCTLYRRATRHVLTRVAKCIDVDGGIFENVLY